MGIMANPGPGDHFVLILVHSHQPNKKSLDLKLPRCFGQIGGDRIAPRALFSRAQNGECAMEGRLDI